MKKVKALLSSVGRWLLKTVKSLHFIKTFVVGAVITVVGYLVSHERGHDVMFALCDGFFVSGVLLLCWAGLVFSTQQGTFDIFSYGISHLFKTRWPGFSTMSEEHEKEKFADYRMRVQAKRKYPFGTLLAAGIYALVAVILFLVYYV